MKNLTITMLTLALVASPVFAQTNATPPKTTAPDSDKKDDSMLDTIKEESGKVYEKSKEVLNEGKEYAEEKYEDYQAKTHTSAENRDIDNLRLGIAPFFFGALYPTKKAFLVDYSLDSYTSIGGEYQTGGFKISLFDLKFAEFKEDLYLLPYKAFMGNSFYWKVGLGLRKYRVALGDEFLSTLGSAVGEDELFQARVLEVQNEVALVGLGNEWQFDPGFYWGFDWLEILVPIGKGKVKDDLSPLLTGDSRKMVLRAVDYMERKVSFNILKIKAGWAF
ncbi:MAG: hypothetical protein AB7T49_04830 [Oligoflexales bacterium]